MPSRNLQRATAFSSMLVCMCVRARICTDICVSRDGVKFHQEQEKSVSKSGCAYRQGEQEPALLKPRFGLLSARTRPNGHPFARRGDGAVLHSLLLQRSCRKLARGARGIPAASPRRTALPRRGCGHPSLPRDRRAVVTRRRERWRSAEEGSVGGRAGAGAVGLAARAGVAGGRVRTHAPVGAACFGEGPGGHRCPAAAHAVPCHPGAGCHGNQTSLLGDKQLDVLARFLQD